MRLSTPRSLLDGPLSAYPLIHQSIYLSIYLSTNQSTCVSLRCHGPCVPHCHKTCVAWCMWCHFLPECLQGPWGRWSLSAYQDECLSIALSIACLFVYRSVHLSVYLSICSSSFRRRIHLHAHVPLLALAIATRPAWYGMMHLATILP